MRHRSRLLLRRRRGRPTRSVIDQSIVSVGRSAGPAAAVDIQWQGRGDSNSQPLVLETSALPIELHPCDWRCRSTVGYRREAGPPSSAVRTATVVTYLMILVTTPEPTVRPPSRMAKRTFSSMAIGEINSTCSCTLSPGMHISAPPSRLAVPVTSVVRK